MKLFNKILLNLFFVLIVGCGGGGGENNTPELIPSAPTSATPPPSVNTWPSSSWEVVEPSEANMDQSKLNAALNYAFQEGRNTQSVVIIRHGVVVAERYKEGKNKDSLATSWSGAKSFTSALIGLAIDQGYIGSIDDKACNYLERWSCEEIVCLSLDCPLSRPKISIRDILEMRSGLSPTDGISIYSDKDDQLLHSLERSILRDPGETYLYSNEDSMILSAVISAATGLKAKDYAEQELFLKINMIGDWWTDKEGHTMTYCCIDTTARNFARFGLLYARSGKWDGQQIISDYWYLESTKLADGLNNYGLHWWVYPSVNLIGALGLHTNDIWVYKDLDLVIVRNSDFTKFGTESVRSGQNIHVTTAPNNWNNTDFLTLVTDSIND
jgi:CubicO group peptidase (beta-lactamase class C family)